MTLRPVVLFDFDGTLADTIPLIVQSFQRTFSASNLPALPEDEVRSWIGLPLRHVFEERFPGRGDALTATYREWNLARHDELIVAVEGMAELLQRLSAAGVRLGVVSSKRADLVGRGLQVVGLAGLIEVLAGMDETARHKPHPDPLLFAADLLEATPDDCVYVGDATVDVLSAQAAGMASIAVTWGAGARQTLAELKPDAVVDSVAELEQVLLG